MTQNFISFRENENVAKMYLSNYNNYSITVTSQTNIKTEKLF